MAFGLLALWFGVALFVSISGGFRNASPLALALTVWGLVAAVFIASRIVPPLGDFGRLVTTRSLVAFHLTRFVGIALILMYQAGRFPFSFGVMGGVGDIVTACGAAAVLLLWKPEAGQKIPGWVVFWNAFGFADILGTVTAALRESLRDYAMMTPLREFPLSLLPMFFVPLIIVSHILIFIRYRRQVAA